MTVRPAQAGGYDPLSYVEWTNWSENTEVVSERVYFPRRIREVSQVVREAGQQNKGVRAAGSRWSFSDVMATEDYLVDTSELRGVIAFSRAGQVWLTEDRTLKRLSIFINSYRLDDRPKPTWGSPTSSTRSPMNASATSRSSSRGSRGSPGVHSAQTTL